MMPQLAVAVASCAGATLFLGAGFVFGRLRRATPTAAEPASEDAATADAGLQVETLQRRLQEASEAQGELQKKLAAARAEIQALGARGEAQATQVSDMPLQLLEQEKALTQLRAANEALTAELAQAQQAARAAGASQEATAQQLTAAQQALRQAQAAGQQAAASGQDSARLAAELKDREAKLAAALERANGLTDLQLERDRLVRRVADLERVQDEKATLTAELTRVRQELAEAGGRVQGLEKVEGERHDLAIELQVASERAAQLEQARADIHLLQQQLAETQAGQQQLEALRAENRELRSRGLVATPAPRAAVEASSRAGVGAILQKVLNELSARPSARGGVVADEQGLIVAGVSEHAEALAALSVTLSDLGRRAQTNLPFAGLSQCVVADPNGVTVTAIPIQSSGNNLMVVCLTAGPGPTQPSVLRAVSAHSAAQLPR